MNHLVVENMNGGNLSGDARRDGNNVPSDEGVVGGFVGKKLHEIPDAKIQQHRQPNGGRPEK